ncbi:hypothetical protein N7668_21735 [Pseudomonas fulva]|uniref:hypothetical protein n=1 Tax=Pseudomonas fulva TaxID=47880 RepID=UPI00244C1820|nr:hypothetical protein [Pseudomonas fulva]MDH0573869.1 hypothetical protein [Pseudomonas fulva]
MSNSKAAIVQWMRVKHRLSGWGSIAVMDRAKLNQLLSQEYISRFGGNGMLPPINGDASLVGNYKVYLQNFILDRPRLSFENADLNSSKARLRMTVIGGNQVNLERRGDWYIYRIDWVDPLVGPQLSLELDLNDVPGNVAEDGAVFLDLQRSDDFQLSFPDHNQIQQLSADFFKRKFQALEPAQRVWQLGQIIPGSEPLLEPASFRLRTQSAPTAEVGEQGDGAVLAFVRMHGSHEGNLPGNESDFKYLIPSEGNYSATVLFDKQRLMVPTLLQALRPLLSDDSVFAVTHDEQGQMESVRAISGHISFERKEFSRYGASFFAIEGQRINYEVHWGLTIDPIVLKDNFSISFIGERMEFKFVLNPVGFTEVLSLRDDLGFLDEDDFRQFDDMPVIYPSELAAVYQMNESGVMELLDFSLTRPAEPQPPEEGTEIPASLATSAINRDLVLKLIFLEMLIVTYLAVRDPLTSLVQLVIRPIQRNLQADMLVEQTARETLRTKFGGAIIADDVVMPKDIACFGSIAPRLTTFELSPLEPIISARATQPLTVTPLTPGLNWCAELVWGQSSSPGTVIDGLFQAPPVSAIDGDFIRVKVTATDPQTGFAASALITVVTNVLSVSPLVELCDAEDRVPLSAAGASGADLEWRILGDTPEGRLASTTASHNTYFARPDSSTSEHLIERIEVCDKETGQTRQICIVTRSRSGASVVLQAMDLAKGTAQLQLQLNASDLEADWTVLAGPGRMEQNLYHADPASAERFAIVEGRFEFPPFGVFTNVIVLALPLFDHDQAYRTLCAEVTGVAG